MRPHTAEQIAVALAARRSSGRPHSSAPQRPVNPYAVPVATAPKSTSPPVSLDPLPTSNAVPAASPPASVGHYSPSYIANVPAAPVAKPSSPPVVTNPFAQDPAVQGLLASGASASSTRHIVTNVATDNRRDVPVPPVSMSSTPVATEQVAPSVSSAVPAPTQPSVASAPTLNEGNVRLTQFLARIATLAQDTFGADLPALQDTCSEPSSPAVIRSTPVRHPTEAVAGSEIVCSSPSQLCDTPQ